MSPEARELTPAPRPGVDNVFFALVPEGQAGAQAIDIQSSFLPQLGHKPYLVPESCLHVSLLDIGIKKNLVLRSFESTIAMAKEAADKFSAGSFEVGFDQALSFNAKAAPKKAFVLQMGEGREQVLALCKKLKLCLAMAGVHSDDKAAAPHMTLARAVQTIPLTEVSLVRWTATRLVLVHSVVGDTRHIHLQSWPLPPH
ncbi:2'-5' RNA ligase family protein [Polaromonas sp. YR568]|uniref:2'-5' RNA ligase family protein n=1 Tax=Polaromonas sp. YR568 TaxID=1855301 RepID=UPI0011142BF3|nr:2'-5' RNA ligase family protein [Polaromonas sp. YR568]